MAGCGWAERNVEENTDKKNKWPRYALIGGRSLQWAQKYCWPGGERRLAVRLLSENLTMVVVALMDKVLRKIRKTDPSIILSAEQLQRAEKPPSMAEHRY